MCGKCLEKRVNACVKDKRIEMAPPYPIATLLKVDFKKIRKSL
jgi:hypothetical protein